MSMEFDARGKFLVKKALATIFHTAISWDAKLGFQPSTTFPVSFSSLRPGGGTFPCVCFRVAKLFGCKYLLRGEDTKAKVLSAEELTKVEGEKKSK